jgi:hypothetical protein
MMNRDLDGSKEWGVAALAECKSGLAPIEISFGE